MIKAMGERLPDTLVRTIEELLLERLPHGSGVDLKWRFEWEADRLVCFNSFHCLNDAGYYEGWADFSITLKYQSLLSDKDVSDFRLQFHGSVSQRLAKKRQLREYLGDLFHYALCQEE